MLSDIAKCPLGLTWIIHCQTRVPIRITCEAWRPCPVFLTQLVWGEGGGRGGGEKGSLIMCISNKSPGDAEGAGQVTTRSPQLWSWTPLITSVSACPCESRPTYLASVLQTSVSCLPLLLLQVLGPCHLRRPSCPPDWIPAAAPPQPALPLPQVQTCPWRSSWPRVLVSPIPCGLSPLGPEPRPDLTRRSLQ